MPLSLVSKELGATEVILVLLLLYDMCLFVDSSTTRKFKSFVDQKYKNTFMHGMHTLRQNAEYTDVTLESDDIQILCHRNVLAVASAYFKALFRSGLEKGSSVTVQLTIEPKILSSVIDYIYTGEIELTANNVEGLVKACGVLKLDSLKAACEDFMVKQVERETCFRFYHFAALYRLVNVKQHAKRFILSEFKSVAFMDEFRELSCTYLIDIIKDDGVNVEYEDVVFESVLGWARHDLVNRKSSFEVILEHVRLPYCSPSYLRHIKDKSDLLTSKCFEYLHEAMAFQADSVHKHETSSCRTVPRTNFPVKTRLMMVGGLNVKNNYCQYFVDDTNCWEWLTDLPDSVETLYSACRVDGGLLVGGGYDNGEVHDQCWLFDAATKKWEAMPPLVSARYFHGSVSLGDCVYVVAGMCADHTMLASVECLNLKRRHWSSLPDIPNAVSDPMVVTYSNKIVVFGGRDASDNDLCWTQIFDTTQNQWSTRSDMPEQCSFGAAVTLNDCIYVVGGYRRTCLKYEPDSDTWTRLSRPALQHGCGPAVVWRGSVLVAGGEDDEDQQLSVIEQYNPHTDTWSVYSSAQLEEPMSCHYIFTIDLYDP